MQRGYINPIFFFLLLLLKRFGKLDRWLFYFPDRTPAHHCLLHPSDALTRTPLEVKEPVDVGWPPSYHPPNSRSDPNSLPSSLVREPGLAKS